MAHTHACEGEKEQTNQKEKKNKKEPQNQLPTQPTKKYSWIPPAI